MKLRPQVNDHSVFAFLYLGAFFITAISSLFFTNWAELKLGPREWLTLVYLGVLASGICFFLWNLGARKTNTGTLAVFNNLKVPLAIAISILVFGEKGDIPQLLAGGAIVLAALLINECKQAKKPT